MSKKLLVEQDIDDLHDFQKILLLNKGKLDYNDVEFIDEDGEDYSDIIEVTKNGLLFNFDDLEEFDTCPYRTNVCVSGPFGPKNLLPASFFINLGMPQQVIVTRIT